MQAFAGIEAITMKNQEAATIGQLMLKFFGNFAEPGFQHELSNQWMSEESVVVADSQSDLSPAAGQLHDAANNIVAGRWPGPATSEAPAINKITNEIQVVRLLAAEKAKKWFGMRVAKAQMQIAQEQTANVRCGAWEWGVRSIGGGGSVLALASGRGPNSNGHHP